MRTRYFNESERAFRRALELNPNFALAHAFMGTSLNLQGASEDAIKSAQYALRLSPNDRLVSTYASRATASANFIARNYAECVAWARKIVEKTPDDLIGHFFLTAALALQGHIEAAARERDILLRLQPEYSIAWVAQQSPFPLTGEVVERMREGLRLAGVPEA